MSETKIAWAEKVWNPITGCTKISAGCKNCYASRFAKRLAAMGTPGYDPADPFKVTFHPKRLEQPLKWRKPARIFVCSMGDLFHDDVKIEQIQRVVEVIRVASWHTFLVLTKRPERMARYFGHGNAPRNIWLGVSVEDGATVYDRIMSLDRVSSFCTHFVSYEPALGPVDFTVFRRYIKWLIIGGESGPGARVCDIAWLCRAVDAAKDAGVPVFVKQLGARPVLDGKPYPVTGAGRDMSEWPEELRVQEYPEGL